MNTRSTHRTAFASMVLALGLLGGCKSDPPVVVPDCTTAEDCEPGQLCTMDGTCVTDAECTRDDECTDCRQRCDVDSLKCVWREGFGDECDVTRPCAFGQFCSPLLGRCLDSIARDCVRRANCPAGQMCDRSASKCVPDPGCYGDDFCDAQEICDKVNRVCRALAIECTRCGTGDTCEGGATCDVPRKECVAAGAEPACDSGEFCDLLGRCVQCTNNSQCGPGLFCNTATGRCDSNTVCANDPSDCPDSQNVTCVLCNLPQVCNSRTRRCEAPARECATDVECEPGEFCDTTLDVPICVERRACINDQREGPSGNDNPAQATLLQESETMVRDLFLCPGETDWYQLDVKAGTFLTVDARFAHDDGDIDIQLFLADGESLLDESRSTTDNERVELDAGTDLTVLVRVFFQVPVVNASGYRLLINRDQTSGMVCPDDGNEPDDNIGAAKDLVSDMPYEGRLCAADPDWFALRNVPAGQRISARLDFIHRLGDLELELYRAGSRVPLARATSVTDNETIEFDARYAGDYFFRVFAKRADQNVYTLRADLRPNPAAACLDDRFEPNDEPSAATRAPDATMTVAPDLTLCPGDEDWYVVNLGPGEAVTAEVGFQPASDIELRLYRPGSNSATTAALRGALLRSQREFLAYRAPGPGDYLLRVHGVDERQSSPYELRVDRQPPFICEPDMVEGMMTMNGSSMADAFPLPDPAPTRLDGLTFCSGDDDWYQVQLPVGFRHYMRLHYIDQDATLDLALHDNAGTQLAATGGAGVDVKEIAGNVPDRAAASLSCSCTYSSPEAWRPPTASWSTPSR